MSVWSGLKKRLLKIIFPEARTLLTLPDKPFPTKSIDVTPEGMFIVRDVESRAVQEADHVVVISEFSSWLKLGHISLVVIMLAAMPLLAIEDQALAWMAPLAIIPLHVSQLLRLSSAHSARVKFVRKRYGLGFSENAYRPLIEQG